MMTSTKPYLIRALHEWCVDNGHTPYLSVWVDDHVTVPMAYVKDNEIVLNVSYHATGGLTLGNDMISFSARFGGVAHDIFIPVNNVMSIFARETGEGMGFEVTPLPPLGMKVADSHENSEVSSAPAVSSPVTPSSDEPPPPSPPPSGRGGYLRIVK